MNRLILVGNGFDLAHGLKTSYRDFIYWYMKDCVENAFVKATYEDTLLKINRNYNAPVDAATRSEWVLKYLSSFKAEPSVSFSFISSDGWGEDDSYNDRSDLRPFLIVVKSPLLQSLLVNCNEAKWVDIESDYFDKIKEILTKGADDKSLQLMKLNTALTFIILKLEAYLGDLPPAEYNADYKSIFTSGIKAQDLYPKGKGKEEYPVETCLLNFNYTNTLEQYVKLIADQPKRKKPAINYIHGKLNDLKNAIVFGFGDEVDKAYKQMEEDNKVQGYFDYIKSFWYLRTSNYKALVNFLDVDDYQVFILGHSCGLSDRTMLQMIFEHPRCKSIKIFYYDNDGDDNYVNLTHEIARHFTDKGMMRKKIVAKDGSEKMPQYKASI